MQPNSNTRQLRSRVRAAFRRLAQGSRRKSAYAATVAFYRSGGQTWSKQLG